MKIFRFFPVLLLCAAPIAGPIHGARADDATKTPTTTEEAQKTILVREADANRAIEVVTDHQETVPEFFARQKLVLIDNANSDGKFWSVPQLINGDVSKIFVSYPLQNDQGFRPYRYGDFYNLEKLSPAVAALFGEDANWENTMLILVTYETNSKDGLNKTARLVGRVSIKNRAKWRPEMDAELLKYQQPDAKTDVK